MPSPRKKGDNHADVPEPTHHSRDQTRDQPTDPTRTTSPTTIITTTTAATAAADMATDQPDPADMTRHHHHHHQQVRELRDLTRLVRTALDAAGEEGHDDDDDGVDAAFARLRGRCGVLCGELLGQRGRGGRGHGRTASSAASGAGGEDVGVAAAVVMGRARRRSVAVAAGGRVEGACGGVAGVVADVDGASLEAVGEWRACLEELAVAHKSSLAKTYKRFEHFAAPEILDALFAERRSRAQIVGGWMKNFGAYKRMDAEVVSAGPGVLRGKGQSLGCPMTDLVFYTEV